MRTNAGVYHWPERGWQTGNARWFVCQSPMNRDGVDEAAAVAGAHPLLHCKRLSEQRVHPEERMLWQASAVRIPVEQSMPSLEMTGERLGIPAYLCEAVE